MLLYGNAFNIPSKCIPLDFLTCAETGYERIQLIPRFFIGYPCTHEFDVNYASWIMNNDYNFCEFFKIIEYLMNGFDVYIITSDDDNSIDITESLLKLIQVRYGYNATKIATFDDLVTCESGEFSYPYGLCNYDCDLARYISLIDQNRGK